MLLGATTSGGRVGRRTRYRHETGTHRTDTERRCITSQVYRSVGVTRKTRSQWRPLIRVPPSLIVMNRLRFAVPQHLLDVTGWR